MFVASSKQIALIEKLLRELGWDRDDIETYIGEDYREYEALDTHSASELIEELIYRKRTGR